MHPDYCLLEGPPSLDDYLHLRAASGLSPRTPEQGQPALDNSWAWFHVKHTPTETTVGMGRLLGDGGWYFMVADMATLPEHQHRGIGRAILQALLDRVDEHAPPGAYITLMADAPGRPLYESLGFVETAPHSIGMRLG